MKSISVRLTDHDPLKDRGPLHAASQTCAEYHKVMDSLEVVELICTSPLYAWGRYLFLVPVTPSGFFHLSEVEVYDGKL